MNSQDAFGALAAGRLGVSTCWHVDEHGQVHAVCYSDTRGRAARVTRCGGALAFRAELTAPEGNEDVRVYTVNRANRLVRGWFSDGH